PWPQPPASPHRLPRPRRRPMSTVTTPCSTISTSPRSSAAVPCKLLLCSMVRSVEEYIAAQPEAVRPTLGLVRSAIRNAVPKAEESISYNIPTYKSHGDPVLYFAAWKQHYSLYPATGTLLAAFA